MDVATIAVPRRQVDEKLREYRRGLHRKADDEWQRVVTAYEAAESGKPLIVLSSAIANCPRDEMGRPKLAIARADRTLVRYTRHRNGNEERFSTHPSEWRRRRGSAAINAEIRVPVIEGVTPPVPALPSGQWEVTGTAPVPLVPPAAKGHRDLSKYCILWEVLEWKLTPPVDPYLLLRVADDLYVVEAEWDLTDIERAVMASRARA